MRFPQRWPHSHLSLVYVNRNIKYEDLKLEEFCAGYAAILEEKLPAGERDSRITHLKDLMYLSTHHTWSSVLTFHAACLLEIERGHLQWGDSFQNLMPTTLTVKSSKQINAVAGGASSFSQQGVAGSSNNTGILFCRDFQKGTCAYSKDHNGVFKGQTSHLRHICAKCWLSAKSFASHPEMRCPLVSPVPSEQQPAVPAVSK